MQHIFKLKLIHFLIKWKTLKGKLLFTIITVFTLIIALPFTIWCFPEASGQVAGNYSLQDAFPNLTFNQHVGIYSPDDGSNRIFVVEQAGIVRVFQNSPTTDTSTVFLDIQQPGAFRGRTRFARIGFSPKLLTKRLLLFGLCSSKSNSNNHSKVHSLRNQLQPGREGNRTCLLRNRSAILQP